MEALSQLSMICFDIQSAEPDRLDCDLAANKRIHGSVNHTHCAVTQLSLNLISAQLFHGGSIISLTTSFAACYIEDILSVSIH
jgi:hypothetical protein